MRPMQPVDLPRALRTPSPHARRPAPPAPSISLRGAYKETSTDETYTSTGTPSPSSPSSDGSAPNDDHHEMSDDDYGGRFAAGQGNDPGIFSPQNNRANLQPPSSYAGSDGDYFPPDSPASIQPPNHRVGAKSQSSWNMLAGQSQGQGGLGLESAWSCLPHPVKAYRGGEDVHMVVNVGGVSLIGVFDGVGGWADLGIDPALYAREMAGMIEKQLRDDPELFKREDKPLVSMLQNAYEELKRQELPGSCTACLALYTGDGQLHVLNLGDSGIHVVRDGLSVFCTYEQQHYFNCPFQLGMGSDDSPLDADYYVLEDIAEGDVIVAATDGVWDNVFEEDMVKLIVTHNSEPKHVAEALGALSHQQGADHSYLSPFAVNAIRQGLRYFGGKLDDVTVVVARVGPSPRGSPGQKTTSLPSSESESDLRQR